MSDRRPIVVSMSVVTGFKNGHIFLSSFDHLTLKSSLSIFASRMRLTLQPERDQKLSKKRHLLSIDGPTKSVKGVVLYVFMTFFKGIVIVELRTFIVVLRGFVTTY